MVITVRYYGWVTYQTDKHGEDWVMAEGVTVSQLFERVISKYGPQIRKLCYPFGENDRVMITVNRKDLNDISLFPKGMETELKQDDVVGFIGPMVAGG